MAAAAVEPYSESEAGIIRNGVFAALPDAFGISLGYTNDPTTFKNRSIAGTTIVPPPLPNKPFAKPVTRPIAVRLHFFVKTATPFRP